jgi:predicted O-methyltransferase YrrM
VSIATDDNRKAVVELATNIGARTIVEIGVRRGRLSILLAEVPTLDRLYLVDVWMPERVNTQNPEKNFRSVSRWARKRGDVEVLRMRSDEAVNQFKDGSIDFLYIDGDHSYHGVTSDIKNYRRKVRGTIAGDDYNLKSVKKAVDELLPHRHVHSNGRLWWA